MDFSERSSVFPIQGQVVMSHGAGGKLTHRLIADLFLERYGNEILEKLSDGAVLPSCAGDPVLTTDSYVVRPHFFPGGDIGSLAVHGTVNDLLMCGARPFFLTVGFILEEGVGLETLDKVCSSIAKAAAKAGVKIVAGDTKVVEKGHGDGIYLNTTGLGFKSPQIELGPQRIEAGDLVLINGPVGQHGIAVLAARGELPIKAQIESDSKALLEEVELLLSFYPAIKMLRDPTRGGIATTLNEVARSCGKTIYIDESKLPRDPAVEEVCELLGFDSLYVANEGKVLAFVDSSQAEKILEELKQKTSPNAAIIGEVREGRPLVVSKSAVGGERLVDMLSGDPLPRIC